MMLRAKVSVSDVMRARLDGIGRSPVATHLEIEQLPEHLGCSIWTYQSRLPSGDFDPDSRTGDYWAETVQEAKQFALRFFLVPVDEWEVVEP